MKIRVADEVFGVKRYETTVVSNRNVASFIKELVVALPEGEELEFRAGGYIQMDCPPHIVKYSDFDIEEEYRGDWDKYNMWRFVSKVDEPVSRAYSMANYPEEKGLVKLNVRIATPPPNNDNVPPGIMSSFIFNLKPGDAIVAVDDDPTRTWSHAILELVTHALDRDAITITVEDENGARQDPGTREREGHAEEGPARGLPEAAGRLDGGVGPSEEVLGLDEKGHDYFLQVTDARPDTGGLSGATPAEAVSWGKVDPDLLPDSVVAYTDSTIAAPLLTAYVLEALGQQVDRRAPALSKGAAKAAINKLNGSRIGGRDLTVRFAKPRTWGADGRKAAEGRFRQTV